MLEYIIKFSVHNKLIISIFILILIFFGLYQCTKLPIDAVPDITNNQVQVITQAPSYGALDIERLVTFPIEQSCNNLNGLKEIRSFSRFGLSLVTIVFEDDIDIYWARQQVSERLGGVRASIPSHIGNPELGPITTGLGEIYQYVIRPDKGYESQYDVTELRTIQDWIVRRQLLGVKGVAEVSSFGGKLKQYEIAIHPDRLLAMNLTIHDVFTALEKNNQNTGGAYVEKGPNVYFIRSEGQIESIEDIQNISLTSSINPVLIQDIADVNIGHATRYGAMSYNDNGEVAGAVVMMLKGANSSEVIDNIKSKIEQIKKTLPKGVIIEPFLDRSKMVKNAIHTVRNNLIEGAMIVIFVLVLFLGNYRAGIIVASVIPLSLLFAIMMMNLFGVSGNLMSLGALDFGLIVDGAVIIVEAVIHRLIVYQSQKKIEIEDVNRAVISSSERMMKSAMFGQLIILIVYIPIFSLEGIEGKMFKPMAMTVSFALLGAFLLSITYIPMMSSFLFRSGRVREFHFTAKWIAKIEKFYIQKLELAIGNSRKIAISTIVIFFISILIFMNLGGEFIPTLEEGDFAVETRVLTGSNLNTSIEYCQKAAGILKKNFPEVEKVVTKTGSGEVPTDPMPMEASDMMVILKDKSEWVSATSFDELSEKMSEKLKDIPGLFTSFQYPVQMRFNELMTGAKQDVVCKIYGENLDSLSRYAEQLGLEIKDIKEAENISIEPILGMPQIVIDYDRDALTRYKLDIDDVNTLVHATLAGKITGQLYENERRFDIVVRMVAEDKTLINIENLMIPTISGTQLPLKNIANIQIKNDINQIQRENAKRRIVVGFNVGHGDVQSAVNTLKRKIEKKSFLPAGYYIEYGGAFQNLESAKNKLMIVVPIALILIFVMLYFAFHNLKLASLVFLTVPLSTIGGILFLALRGMPFSISAGIGFIALFGVAVLNGIVLVSEFYKLQSEGTLDVRQVVFQGSKSRLRPVLMTALVASLGFFPMAFSHGSGAEVQRPLATVVIGGLVVSTFLTLFLLPMLYIRIQRPISIFNPLKRFQMNFLLIFSIIFLPLCSQSQGTISLQAAIDSAILRHHDIENLTLKAQSKKLEIKTAINIPKTDLGVNLGSYNSNYFDHALSVNQSIPFPTSFQAQKKWLESNYNLAQIDIENRKYILEKSVVLLYYQYRNLKYKENLWREEDTILGRFLEKMELRYQKGESNKLELISAQNQRNNILNELSKIKLELNNFTIIFNHFIHTQSNYIPDITENMILDDVYILQPKVNKIYEENLNNSILKTKAERSKLMPDIRLGLSSTTIFGTGSDNISYDYSKRFNSFQLGLSVPIFPSAKSWIKVRKEEEKIAKNELEIAKELTQLSKSFYLNEYENAKGMLERLEKVDMKNAKELKTLANKQLLSGEINYLDWALLMQQANAVFQNYYQTQSNFYQSYIQLKYLTIREF